MLCFETPRMIYISTFYSIDLSCLYGKKGIFNETQEVRKNMWLNICVKDWCIWLKLLISKHSMWKCMYLFVVSLSVDILFYYFTIIEIFYSFKLLCP